MWMLFLKILYQILLYYKSYFVTSASLNSVLIELWKYAIFFRFFEEQHVSHGEM